MIIKLPTFVKEPVSAVEWFNREKINELIDVVNGLEYGGNRSTKENYTIHSIFKERLDKLDANLKDVSKCATKDIQGIIKRLDNLEKHRDTTTLTTSSEKTVEGLDPKIGHNHPYEVPCTNNCAVYRAIHPTSEPISDISDKQKDDMLGISLAVGSELGRKNQELEAVIKEVYEYCLSKMKNVYNSDTTPYAIVDKLKPFVEGKC